MNPNETQKRRLPDYLKRLFTIKAMSVILIIALLIFGVIGWNKYLSLDNKTTSLGFENISEFATQAAYCTTVNTEEAARNIWGIEIPFLRANTYTAMILSSRQALIFLKSLGALTRKNK